MPTANSNQMVFRPSTAVFLSIAFWLLGFLWGTIVFMSPALRSATPIPFISSNPWISFPILLGWAPLAYLATRNYLQNAPEPETDGFVLGCILVVGNFCLDLVVIVYFFKAGVRYFASATVLLGYAMLFVIPWMTGRAIDNAIGSSR